MRHVLPLSFLIGLTLSVGVIVSAAEWSQFRGPDGQGIASDKGLPTEWSPSKNIRWKVDLPGPGTSSPIFVKDRIYLTCYTGYNVPGASGGEMEQLKRHLVCLDRASGKLRWAKDIPAKLPEQERIRDDHGYASSTPLCDGERIYCFFGKTGVFAFDLEGNELWRADVGSGLNGWGSSNSPVLFEDLVIVNASIESQSLVALDRKSGKEKWRARGIRESWNTPLVMKNSQGKPEVVVAIFGKVLSFDPATGRSLWTCDTDIAWYMVPSLVSDKDIVYCIGGRSNGMLAIRAGGQGDVTDTHRIWTGRKGSNVSSPIVSGGHLYWAHDNQGIVYCADAKTGKVVYEERLPRAGQFYASPVLADGKLYYITRNGKTFVVAARPEFQLLATNELGDRSTFNSSPVVADGRLFVRSDRHLYCIDE